MRSSLCALLGALLLVAPLEGQSFVVDAAGGAGSQFLDLPTAIATVPDGATLIVRAGSYAGGSITQKSLTVLGEGAVFVLFGLTVEDLLPTQRVVVRGVADAMVSFGGFSVSGCDGTVVFEQCDAAISAEWSRDVRIHDWDPPSGGIPLGVYNSRVQVTRATLTTGAAYAAISVVNGVLELTDCLVTGGGGPAGAAPIWGIGSEVRLLGATSLNVVSGASSALAGSLTVRCDLGVSLQPIGAPVAGSGVSLGFLDMPSVTASSGAPGGTANAAMGGPAGALAVLFVGLPGALVPLVGEPDPIAIAAGTEIEMAFGVLSPTLTAGYAVPPNPVLSGVTVTWQGASIDAVEGLQISNAVTYTHG